MLYWYIVYRQVYKYSFEYPLSVSKLHDAYTRDVTQWNYIMLDRSPTPHFPRCNSHPYTVPRTLSFVCEDSTCAWRSGATSAATTPAWTRRFRIRRRQPDSSSSPLWPRKPSTWLTRDRHSSLAKGPCCRPFMRRRSSTKPARSTDWSWELQVSWNYSI